MDGYYTELPSEIPPFRGLVTGDAGSLIELDDPET